ncbi:pilus assembly protein PilB [Archangium primigenium]|nr:pilus assembly protein PilB [Archangium primigenium]
MWEMRLGELWVASGLLSAAQVDQAVAYHRRHGCRLGEAAVALGLLTPEQTLTTLSQHLQLPFVRREGLERVPRALLKCMPEAVLRRLKVCPLRIQWSEEGQGLVYVATSEPDNFELLGEIELVTGCTVKPVLALASDLRRVLASHGLGAEPIAEPVAAPSAAL